MSFFSQNMESRVQGDLVDVIRGGGGGGGGGGGVLRATNEFEVLGEKVSANTVDAALLSSPRGSKRRKGLAKRVICIPAPAADQESNNKSNTSGSVVVPSDLWAWRKYGQKPIKGSPYPRGYYRCSSSKGCSARKQVERSRNDPNMLVITYTSDHNHPWPTHRNSLAGSTRSKNCNNATTTTTTTDANKNQTSRSTSKQEVLLHDDDHDTTMPLSSSMIKEENVEFDRNVFDKSYEPMMFESKDMEFFEGLGGLDPNPMSFFFSSSREFKLDEVGGSDNNSKGLSLDPLSFFDTWDDI